MDPIAFLEKIFDSGLLAGVLALTTWTLWREVKDLHSSIASERREWAARFEEISKVLTTIAERLK